MYNPILLFFLIAAAAIGADSSSNLLRRQTLIPVSCSSQGLKACGVVCIGLSDTCCPSGAGGCPIGTYCDLTSNGEYGCCPNGEICTGPGGAITSLFTQTVLLPGETSTQTEFTTSTSEPTETGPIETSVSTLTSNFVSTYLSPSVSTLTSTFVSTYLSPSVSHSTTPPSHLTTKATATTSLPEYTGAADSNIEGFLSVGLLAFILHFFAN
jgi:hypothetical protein